MSEARTVQGPNEEVLAGIYERALAHEKAGRLDEAASAYRELLARDPLDRGGAAVRLAALGRGEVPARASEAYVEMLFDQHADSFEDILVGQLDYRVPELIAERLDGLASESFGRVLDLGCGTGLVAEALGARAVEIIGLDLSEAMLDICEEKGLYDGLYSADLTAFLADNDEASFDLIVAADVLPYLGQVDGLFAGAAANLTDGGLLVFSSEWIDPEPPQGYGVGPNQRFQHWRAYLESALAGVGFALVHLSEINVRNQDGAPTPGHLIAARRTS